MKHVCDKIWQQVKHTQTCLRMSIVYIGLVKGGDSSGRSPLNSPDYLIRPLFRTMKCVDRETRSATGKCMVFVDEFGWVYPDWRAFKEHTIYADSDIVAPEMGIFTRNTTNGRVQLDSFRAPNTADEIEMQKWKDRGLTFGALGSAAVLAGAAVFPFTAPVIWGAAAVGVAVGAVTGYNSVAQLVKRNYHEQAITLGDREARAHWLAICGTVLGFAASGATTLVRGAATAGNVSKTLLVASNTVCGASIFVNGVSVGNSIFAVAVNDRPLTRSELLQLSVSLFLFTHSVYNYRTAQQMVRETQLDHVANYKDTLSKQGKKNFQKKINARTNVVGADGAMGDTIRNLNTADHYNANFKGSAGYKATAGGLENSKVKESLLPAFVKYIPHCVSALLSIYTVVVKNEGEDNWELLKKMAERILDRYISSGLKVEAVIRDCYKIVHQEAKKKKVPLKDLLTQFKEKETYESIPVVVRLHYAVFRPQAGPFTCKGCGGARMTG